MAASFDMIIARLILPALIIAAIAISPGANAAEEYITVVVKEGDTLWAIAQKRLKDPNKWPEILKHNDIKNPDLIRPGMKLKIPVSLLKAPPATAPGAVEQPPATPPEEADDWAQTTSGKAATIKADYVNGSVFKLTGDGEQNPVATGATMFSSDRMVTDFMSFAGFALPGGGWMTVGSDTRLKIDSIEEGDGSPGGRFLFRLEQGRTVIHTGVHGLKCRLKIGDAVITMAEGVYQARAGDGGPSFLEVYKGKAVVSSGGAKINVGAGKGVALDEGLSPAPQALPPPPTLEPYTIIAEGKALRGVKWEHVKGVASYRIEIAKDKEFRNIVYLAGYAGSTLDMNFFKQFPRGAYSFRLFGVNPNGLWGMPSMPMQYSPGQ